MKKKAIALIPLLARRRRRNRAQRGAKLGGPALLAGIGAAAAVIVRRRRRSAAGFDASPSELSGRQPSTTGDAPDAPPTGEGRPSTFEGDPAETVPKAGIEGVGKDSVIPDTASDDPLVQEAEAAAAAEAAAIGRDVPDTPPSNGSESFSERES
jgi:hypothetical protein